jgi:hypothetical protein
VGAFVLLFPKAARKNMQNDHFFLSLLALSTDSGFDAAAPCPTNSRKSSKPNVVR